MDDDDYEKIFKPKHVYLVNKLNSDYSSEILAIYTDKKKADALASLDIGSREVLVFELL